MGYFGKALMTPASYLPAHMTEVFTQDRAFAIAKLPHVGTNFCSKGVRLGLGRCLLDHHLWMSEHVLIKDLNISWVLEMIFVVVRRVCGVLFAL